VGGLCRNSCKSRLYFKAEPCDNKIRSDERPIISKDDF
jgi:hypothetical protein